MLLIAFVSLLLPVFTAAISSTTTTTHTICYRTASPTPSTATCNVYGDTTYPILLSVGETLTPGDCAQQCRYARSCKAFTFYSQAIGGECTLYNATFSAQGRAFTRGSGLNYANASDQSCFINAYCPPLVLPSPSTSCGARATQAVLNPGFETPLSSPGSRWVAVGNATISTDSSIAYSGSSYGNLTVTGYGVASFYQHLSNLDPFTFYVLQGYVSVARDEKVACFLQVDVDGLFVIAAPLDGFANVTKFTHWDYFLQAFRPPRSNPVLSLTLSCYDERPKSPNPSRVSTYLVDGLSITFPNGTCPFVLQLESTTNATLNGKYLGLAARAALAASEKAEAIELVVSPGAKGGVLSIMGSNLIAQDRGQPLSNYVAPIGFNSNYQSGSKAELVTCRVGVGKRAMFTCAAYSGTKYLSTQFQYCRKRYTSTVLINGLAIVPPGFPENYKGNGCYNINVTALRS